MFNRVQTTQVSTYTSATPNSLLLAKWVSRGFTSV